MKPRRTKTAGRLFSVMLAIGHLFAAPLAASDTSGLDHRRGVRKAKAPPRAPQVKGRMSSNDAFALKIAYGRAIKRLEKIESCRDLFDGLDMDGLQALAGSQYRPVQTDEERAYCTRGVYAYTAVGHNRIMICRHFFHMQDARTKMAVLIHEALHTAGMGEAPGHPDCMTAEEITAMVEKACLLR